jgi:hypothetical protein
MARADLSGDGKPAGLEIEEPAAAGAARELQSGCWPDFDDGFEPTPPVIPKRPN